MNRRAINAVKGSDRTTIGQGSATDGVLAVKKIIIAALAASAAIVASPAAAQSANATGTISLTGSVGSKCLVLSNNATASNFNQSVGYGELANANGNLRSGLDTEFSSAITPVRVVCTTANPVISIDANPLAIQNAAAPTEGYSNSIDFDAHVALTLTTGGTVTKDNRTVDAPLVESPVGGRLAGTGANLVITANNFRTVSSPTAILDAGSYSGSIAITVAPNATPAP
jgi:hypothetical protein